MIFILILLISAIVIPFLLDWLYYKPTSLLVFVIAIFIYIGLKIN